MDKKYEIGVDIGGTNTDAVIIDEAKKIICSIKTSTTDPLEMGFEMALMSVIKRGQIDKSQIKGIFVGTTHGTNALLERKELNTVGVIRIAGQKPDTIQPCAFWPKDLRNTVYRGYENIDGGFECDGRPLSKFDKDQAKEAAIKLLKLGAKSLAIVGVFSPINAEQEIQCAAAIKEELGADFPISISSEIGGIGFIERENATILNSSLKKAMEKGFKNLKLILAKLEFNCDLWITQNDGTLITLQQAIETPLLTISSGPTNSFVGACKLSNLKDAIIIDIGGTSSDIGMVMNGFPKRSMHNVEIGGVSLNFRMPDVLSLAIGGGSFVNKHNVDTMSFVSCGKNLQQMAQIFGGNSLTLTDVACKMGLYEIKNGNNDNISLSIDEARDFMQKIQAKLDQSISKMKGKHIELPIIAVGGGAFLLSRNGNGNGKIDRPKHYDIANAYGAVLADISATVDTVVSLEKRSEVLDQLKCQAYDLALRKGAKSDKTTIVEMSVLPYHYLSNQMARVIVKAAGPRI